MKVIFFGLGSIGQKHAKILQEDFNHELFAFRSSKEGTPNPLRIQEVYSWEEVDKIAPDIAFITNPTFLHVSTALECAKRSMHIFMEKPLSVNLDGLDVLEKVCLENNITFYTAYCLRFHPVIVKIKELLEGKKVYHVRATCSSYLPLWRQGRDYTKNYSAHNDQGGGVILDLSHEFDYIQYLLGPIQDMKINTRKISDLKIDAEDFVDALMTIQGPIYANLHISFFSHHFERRLVVDFEGGYVSGDLNKFNVEILKNEKINVFTYTNEKAVFYKAQLEYFFNNLDNPGLMNSLTESKELLIKLMKIKELGLSQKMG